ncbi:hypothetical protein F4680DRAFT_451478 [Xylaria scruposa]|nr:hypothetical protein F4680DRAFT_451478 [Xylaria scruposa]
MVFECLSSIDCECGMMDGFTENSIRQLKAGIRLGHVPRDSELRPDEDIAWQPESIREILLRPRLADETEVGKRDYAVEVWHDLLSSYSEKFITFPSDTLPAVAGLASRWCRLMNSKYLCGLWANSLLSSLLWMVNIRGQRSIERQTKAEDTGYIAPTWSWAAAQQEVTWANYHYKHVDYLIEIDLQNSGSVYAGPDIFGAVIAGWLSLTGNVMTVTFEKMSSRCGHLTKNGVRSEFTPDEPTVVRSLVGKEVVCLHVSTTKRWPHVYPYLALVLTQVDIDNEAGSDTSLLPDSVKASGHIYRRVGITRRYELIDWSHEKDSERVSLVLI